MTQLQLPQNYGPITFNREIRGIRSNNGRFERYAERYDITFQVSDDPDLLDAAYRLRYEVFGKEMGIFNEDGKSGRETDLYDQHSLHAFLHINGELATYARMITDHGGQFPSESFHKFPVSCIRTNCVELSRAASVKKWRRSEVVWLGFWLALKQCAKQNINFILGLSTSEMFNGFKHHNLHFYHVSNPIQVYGYKAYPYIIDIEKSLNM